MFSLLLQIINKLMNVLYLILFGPFYLLYILKDVYMNVNLFYLILFGPFYLLYMLQDALLKINIFCLIEFGPVYLLYMLKEAYPKLSFLKLILFGPFYLLYALNEAFPDLKFIYFAVLVVIFCLYKLWKSTKGAKPSPEINLNWKRDVELILDHSVEETRLMSLTFGDKHPTVDGTLTMQDTAIKPQIRLQLDNEAKITFVLVDIGSNNDEEANGRIPYIHYLVVNVSSDGNGGDEVFDYKMPSHSNDARRFAALLYIQTNSVNYKDVILQYPKRDQFPFMDFLKEHKLFIFSGIGFNVSS
ncbi:hypothetical protein ACOME3_002415 [Neoechinorhynchus agilis]